MAFLLLGGGGGAAAVDYAASKLAGPAGLWKQAASECSDRAKRKPQRPFAEWWAEHKAAPPGDRDGAALRARLRGGVPPELRAEVWLHVLVEDQPGEERSLFRSEDVPESVAKLIDTDVPRTFAHSQEFKDACSADRLRSVLRRFAAANADIGYVQSLNFLAGILVLVLGADEHVPAAMGALVALLRARQWYAEGMEQLRADALVLRDLLQERLPVINGAFRTHDFEPLLVTPKWFLSLFSITLEGEALLRAWDAVLADGIEAAFRIGLALFARREEEIVRADAIDDIAALFLSPQGEVPPDVLLAAAYHKSLLGSGIDKSELEKRRCRALSKISSSDSNSPGGGLMAKRAMVPYLFARGTRDLMDAGRKERGGSEGYKFGDMSRGIASRVESKLKESGGDSFGGFSRGVASRLQATFGGGLGSRPPGERPAGEGGECPPPPGGEGAARASPLVGTWRYGDCEVRVAEAGQPSAGGAAELRFEERMVWGGRMSGVLRQEGDWHVGPAVADGEETVGTMRMRLSDDTGLLVASFRAAGETVWSEDAFASRVAERAD